MITLTETAAGKVKELLEREATETNGLALRVAVQPGGCSGLRYALYFDDQISEKDQTAEFAGVKVVVDKMSVPYLKGASIDYVDSLQQSGFTINNPNAQSTCACGDSFH
jgi:iron-sulfur cluster assembly accessory protein